MLRLLAAAAVAAALPVLAASAATPDKGTVSSSSPTVTWTGTLEHPYATHIVFAEEPTAGMTGQAPCSAPACDTFTLTVADGPADLAFVFASEQTGDISMRVQDPDGAWSYYDGWSDASPAAQKFTIKKAKPGDYTINVVARIFGQSNPTAVDDTADYTATVTRGGAKPAPAPAPVVAPAASATPAPSATPKPAAKKASKRAACRKKAKKIKNKRKRARALKRCAKIKR